MAAIWTCRDKTKIAITEMTHTHLANTIQMLRRDIERLEAEVDACFGYSGGEMAEMYAEQAADEAYRKLHNKRAWLSVMLAEHQRREGLSTVDDAISVMQEALA